MGFNNMNPLVSVIVVTYNSSDYVCETLDSIYNQDYQNLELIVSDDGSKDDTINVVTKWIDNKGNRFSRCEVVSTPCNTGIPANCNRGIRASKGDWIKLFAGDDLLTSNCISVCMNYVKTHVDCNVLFTKMTFFEEINGKKCLSTPPELFDDVEYVREFNQSDAARQFYMLLKDGCFLAAPTQFFNSSFIKEHPYPEIYKYEEDYPMWLNLTKAGFKLNYITSTTVLYRRSNSLTRRINDYYSRNYMKTRSLFFWNECYDYYKENNLKEPYEAFRKLLLRYELCEAFTQNKRSIVNSVKMCFFNFIVSKFARYYL